jgi:DHA1 family tetracycline resistance protein-like MFS transporter
VLRQPKVGLLIVLYFLATFCFAAFESTFSLLVNEKYRMDAEHAGYLFTYCGVMAALLQGGLVGRLNKRFGEQKLIFSSLLITGLGLVLLPAMGHLTGLLVALALFAAGSGINRPPTFGLISLLTSPEEQGATLGVAQSAGSLARILSPIFANWLYTFHHSMPYYISAGIAVVAGIAAWIYLCSGSQAAITPRMKVDAGSPVG